MFNNNSKSSSMLDKISYTHANNEWNAVPIMYPNQLNFNKALGLRAVLIHNLHLEEFNQYNLNTLNISSYIISKYFIWLLFSTCPLIHISI